MIDPALDPLLDLLAEALVRRLECADRDGLECVGRGGVETTVPNLRPRRFAAPDSEEAA